MNTDDLLDAFGEISEKHIAEAEDLTPARKTRRWPVIAAVAAVVAALGITAAASGGFHLADYAMKPMEGSLVDDRELVLSFQGPADSPESQAINEWVAYEWTYIDSMEFPPGNYPSGLANRYVNYGAINWEMAEKLEEIAEKYGVALHEYPRFTMDYGSMDPILEVTGGSFYDESVIVDLSGHYLYENGTFKAEGGWYKSWETWIDVSFFFSVHGTISYNMGVGDLSDCDEYTYGTSSGQTLLVIRWPNGDTAVIAEYENATLYVSISHLYDAVITEDIVIEIIEAIDWAKLAEIKKPSVEWFDDFQFVYTNELDPGRIIEEFSFPVSLDYFGDMQFIAYAPEEAGVDVHYVLSRDGVTRNYTFPPLKVPTGYSYELTDGSTFEDVKAVNFTDLNGDGLEDLVVIGNYTTRKGDLTSRTKIFMAYPGGVFTPDQETAEAVNAAIKTEDMTMDTVLAYLVGAYSGE